MNRQGSRTVDLVSGGFPCQPFSCAGKRRGREDDRYLWPEMLRVIQEIRPAWVVGENVAGIIGMALDQALADLESIGYETRAFVFPACAVDAPHRRDRVAIVAHAHRVRCQRAGQNPQERQQFYKICSALSESANDGADELLFWPVEPGVGRVADGVPHRVDRIRCLGNAVVPQQFYPVFAAIAEVERMMQP